MSELAKQAFREKLSGCPDVQVLSRRDAEKLLTDAAAYLMKCHRLGGTLADWRPGYVSELESVISRRCTEVFGDEYYRVLKHEKVGG